MNKRKLLKAMGGISAGLVLILLSWIVTYCVHAEYGIGGFSLSILVGMMGISAGWLTGILASPVNANETRNFGKYASLVASFFSGYVLAQLEPSMGEIFGNKAILTKPVYGIRIALFLVNFLCAAITVYVYRIYVETEAPEVGQD